MSKSHPEQWAVNPSVHEVADDVLAGLRAIPTTQIADAGGPVGIVGPGIGPIAGGTEICGTAVTLWTRPGDILFVLKAPDLVGPGDVLVVDAGARPDAAVIGDILGGSLQRNGGVGLVVDGAVRDRDGLDALGFPTFARGTHPATGSNEGPGALNVVVSCGGVPVHPGDVVRADASGVVIIPAGRAGTVLERARAVDERERGWVEQLEAGRSLSDVLGLDDRIAEARASVADPAP